MRARFNTDALVDVSTWWAPLVRALRFAVPWALCTACGVLLVGGPTLRARGADLAVRARLPAQLWPFAGTNVLCLAVFVLVSAALLEHPSRGHALDTLALGVWAVAALGIPLALVASVVPLRELARTAQEVRVPLIAGAALGAAGYGAYTFTESQWPFWQPLASGTVALASALLGLVYSDCRLEGFVISTGDFAVVVTKYCSGYEGVGLFLIFFTTFLLIFRDRLRFPHALVLLPIGSLAVWLSNAVRIAALVIVGREISPEVAIDGFHVYAGWPLIALVALGAVATATRVPAFSARGARRLSASGLDPTALYLLPLLAIVATALVTGAFTDEPSTLYPLRVLVGGAVLFRCRAALRVRVGPVSAGALSLGALAWGLWIALGGPAYAPWEPSTGGTASLAVLAFGCVGSIAIAPLAEELAFRGFLARRLGRASFESVQPRAVPSWCWMLSSVAFGLVHEHVLAASAVGLVYAYAYRRREHLSDAIVAHATTNLLLVLQSACA